MKEIKDKNIWTAILLMTLLVGFSSCEEDFLQVTPKDQLTTEAVFESQQGGDLFLNEIYAHLPSLESSNAIRQNTSLNYDQLNYFSPFYESRYTWAISYRRSQDRALTPSIFRGRTGLYNHGYPAIPFRYDFVTDYIRDCNFFLENLERFKDKYDESWRTQRKAEARVLRAYYYHNLWMAYGGVPLVTKVLNKESMGDDIFKPSVSIRELYDFMVSELDEAAQNLPNKVGEGRVTKGVALALKAWIELYMGDISADPRPAGLSSLEPSFASTAYKASAKTAQEIINLGTYNLFPDYNDQFLAENNNNSESIWAIQHLANESPSSRTSRFGPYASWWTGNQAGTGMPTQNLVDMYRMNNGLPITNPNSGYDPQQPYKNRESRFYQSVIYDSSMYRDAIFTLEGIGQNEALLREGSEVTTGYYRRKGIDPSLTASTMNQEYSNEPIFRYAEILLIYAEAKIKAGEIDQSVVNAIDKVRKRSDLPSIADTYGGTPGKEKLLDVIWHERSVELAFERSKSYWDLIRTRRADTYLNEPSKGIRRDSNDYYETFVVHDNVWPDDHYYLFPIYQNWLERNPAWTDPQNQVDGRTMGQNIGY